MANMLTNVYLQFSTYSLKKKKFYTSKSQYYAESMPQYVGHQQDQSIFCIELKANKFLYIWFNGKNCQYIF